MNTETYIIEYLNADGTLASAHTLNHSELVELLHNLGSQRSAHAYIIS
jgi:hypothetical protein